MSIDDYNSQRDRILHLDVDNDTKTKLITSLVNTYFYLHKYQN